MVDSKYKSLIVKCLSGDEIESRNSLCYRTDEEVSEKFTKTPLIGARKTCWKLALREWEWFMSGSNKLEDLHPSVRAWWEPWNGPEGTVFRNYSCQFRDFAGHGTSIDSIDTFIKGIKYNPFSRRNVITTWNTADMNNEKCLITNCHGTVIQAFVNNSGELSIKTYQRSADLICGVPHNWIQYWAFLLWVARLAGLRPASLVWIGGDVHIYEQHRDLALRIIKASPKETPENGPELIYKPTSEKFLADDFSLDGIYEYILNEKANMVV